MFQSGGCPGGLGPLIKTGLHLMKSVIQPLAKSILISLGLAAASARDAGIYRKLLGPGTTTLIISNDKMEDIIKIVKSHQANLKKLFISYPPAG